MKALVTILAFIIGLTIAGLVVSILGELVFSGGPYKGPSWFVYAAGGAALGAGWGGSGVGTEPVFGFESFAEKSNFERHRSGLPNRRRYGCRQDCWQVGCGF